MADTLYRETNNISWAKAESTMTEGIHDCIDKLYSKHGIDKFVVMEWNGKIIQQLVEKTKTCPTKHYQSVLQQNNPLNTLS